MLCACSGERERIHFDVDPQSLESLATRDYSVSGDWEAKADIGRQFDDQEARALLGHLEYQKGNFDAALQMFQGIDVPALRPRMVKAIAERTKPRKVRSNGEILPVSLMSWHSVSLILEAMFLKSKSLEELGRLEDAAVECKIIIDIVESAWGNGVPTRIGAECKIIEMLHKALDLLPRLWQQAGLLDETVAAYRHALTRPWNLTPQRCAILQKDLAITLLYGGCEVTIPDAGANVSPIQNKLVPVQIQEPGSRLYKSPTKCSKRATKNNSTLEPADERLDREPLVIDLD